MQRRGEAGKCRAEWSPAAGLPSDSGSGDPMPSVAEDRMQGPTWVCRLEKEARGCSTAEGRPSDPFRAVNGGGQSSDA